MSSSKFVFFGRSEKRDGRPYLWLAETYSISSLKPLNGIQRNLTGSKYLTSSTKFVFFGPIGKARWPPRPMIGWDIFYFSSETAKWNSTKLDRKQYLNVLYRVCVFLSDLKNKMAALNSDWLRIFRLLLWNRQREFNEPWQEAKSQHPLPSLCLSGRSEKQDVCPVLWLAEIHFRLLLPNRWLDFNETWQEARYQSTQVHDMWSFGPLVSAPEPKAPKAKVHYCDHTLFVVCLNRWTEFDETWQ